MKRPRPEPTTPDRPSPERSPREGLPLLIEPWSARDALLLGIIVGVILAVAVALIVLS